MLHRFLAERKQFYIIFYMTPKLRPRRSLYKTLKMFFNLYFGSNIRILYDCKILRTYLSVLTERDSHFAPLVFDGLKLLIIKLISKTGHLFA